MLSFEGRCFFLTSLLVSVAVNYDLCDQDSACMAAILPVCLDCTFVGRCCGIFDSVVVLSVAFCKSGLRTG